MSKHVRDHAVTHTNMVWKRRKILKVRPQGRTRDREKRKTTLNKFLNTKKSYGWLVRWPNSNVLWSLNMDFCCCCVLCSKQRNATGAGTNKAESSKAVVSPRSRLGKGRLYEHIVPMILNSILVVVCVSIWNFRTWWPSRKKRIFDKLASEFLFGDNNQSLWRFCKALQIDFPRTFCNICSFGNKTSSFFSFRVV